MKGDQDVVDAAPSAPNGSMPAETGVATVSYRAAQLYAQAQAARSQSQLLAARLRAVHQASAETFQLVDAAWDRAGRLRTLRSAGDSRRLRYSTTARLQARLASMPVIEQAKGIMMAQCGWSEEQAFDALRRASQRENVKMRDLAARIVTQAVRSAAAQRQAGPAAATAAGIEEVSHAMIVSAIAGAAARRQGGQAVG